MASSPGVSTLSPTSRCGSRGAREGLMRHPRVDRLQSGDDADVVSRIDRCRLSEAAQLHHQEYGRTLGWHRSTGLFVTAVGVLPHRHLSEVRAFPPRLVEMRGLQCPLVRQVFRVLDGWDNCAGQSPRKLPNSRGGATWHSAKGPKRQGWLNAGLQQCGHVANRGAGSPPRGALPTRRVSVDRRLGYNGPRPARRWG